MRAMATAIITTTTIPRRLPPLERGAAAIALVDAGHQGGLRAVGAPGGRLGRANAARFLEPVPGRPGDIPHPDAGDFPVSKAAGLVAIARPSSAAVCLSRRGGA